MRALRSQRTIVYYGGCWPTNIGNAFIDLGAVACLAQALPGWDRHVLSEYPRWSAARRRDGTAIDLLGRIEADFVFVSGMTCCDEFIRTEGPALLAAAGRGARIVFNGCGQLDYSEGETSRFRAFLAELSPLAFVSRDRPSFENLADVCAARHDGVDCGFFLPEAYDPPRMRDRDFAVACFDQGPAPRETLDGPVLHTRHSLDGKPSADEAEGEGVLVSDLPQDYLTLYGNGRETHSDRVHACVAALAYGNAARLYSDTPRAALFERVGAGDVQRELSRLDPEALRREKREQVAFLGELLESA